VDLVRPVRIVIDLDRCHLAGECVYNHPQLFAFDDGNRPVVLVEAPDTPMLQLGARQAAEVCPSGAIALLDD
jgi:ferredoxin